MLWYEFPNELVVSKERVVAKGCVVATMEELMVVGHLDETIEREIIA